ncbi:MAG: hypothetical protein HFI88_07475 [Lachnospiraceae bacterium]|nr:hypothetical protein [Lachnospiraceae bacterium]
MAFVRGGGNPADFKADEKHGGHGHHGRHGEEGHGHPGRHGEEGHSHHGGHGPAGRPEDLTGLMRACGHALHHGNAGEEFFDALTDGEKIQLKELLEKLV